ncbi:MAG: hypothetical protein AAGG56_03165 [Pseudomonadota bacterium]
MIRGTTRCFRTSPIFFETVSDSFFEPLEIFGDDGQDSPLGRFGNDTISTGAGNDLIVTAASDDEITAEADDVVPSVNREFDLVGTFNDGDVPIELNATTLATETVAEFGDFAILAVSGGADFSDP